MKRLAPSALILLLAVAPAEATFSIGGVDLDQKLMGAAGASCVFDRSIQEILYVSVPNAGILLTQAKSASHDSVMVQTGVEMMESGSAPQVILGVMTDPSLDNTTEDIKADCMTGPEVTYDDYELRQYGLVDLNGRYDGYESPVLKDYYYDFCYNESAIGIEYTQEHVGGQVMSSSSQSTFAYTAQGNIIAIPTIPAIVDGFENGPSMECQDDLVDRLFHAISAPFLQLEEAIAADDPDLAAGDIRCFGDNEAAAAGIFLKVEDAEGNTIIDIDIVNDSMFFSNLTYNPFPDFVAMYEEWRAENPCGTSTQAPTPNPTSSSATASFHASMATVAIAVFSSLLVIS
ncbi:MAG: hypothetical protein SGILL_007001 [Bacillariaceae sp.]